MTDKLSFTRIAVDYQHVKGWSRKPWGQRELVTTRIIETALYRSDQDSGQYLVTISESNGRGEHYDKYHSCQVYHGAGTEGLRGAVAFYELARKQQEVLTTEPTIDEDIEALKQAAANRDHKAHHVFNARDRLGRIQQSPGDYQEIMREDFNIPDSVLQG